MPTKNKWIVNNIRVKKINLFINDLDIINVTQAQKHYQPLCLDSLFLMWDYLQ